MVPYIKGHLMFMKSIETWETDYNTKVVKAGDRSTFSG